MKNKMERNRIPVLRWLALTVLACIIGLKFYSFNATTLAGNTLPMPFGYGTAVVMSGSMEPTLSVNDLVVIRKEGRYDVGDIVVYQSKNSLVIHRIVDIQGEVITAQGDANNIVDEPIRDVYIKGKLVMAVPGMGGAVKLLKSTPATVIILMAAVLLLEFSWRKEKGKDDAQLDAIKEEIKILKEELKDKEGV